MNYEGPLYGKCGRRYIPLRHTSYTVDRLEKELEEKDAYINHLHEIIFRLNEGKSFVIPGPMKVNPNAPAFPSPDNHFNQLGPVHTSFKFDNP